ncbi:MAG: ABC transporter permease [Verrucomicrobiota bacterium]
MTFLPIVERELRVASRRRGTYFGRLAGAFLAIGLGGWIMAAMSHNRASFEMGKVLFTALSVLLFFYALGGGLRMTADCLSEEKREGTLGLLFLTDLKGYDIVAGKLVANSLNSFYGMLSAFPVLAISLLMGGVTSTELWRVSLVSVNLLFFSLALGMFTSALCRDERKALSAASLLGILFLGFTPLIELSLHLGNRSSPFTTHWLIFSPAFSCVTAFHDSFFKPADFWMPVLMTQIYAWLFLVLASVIVPRSWQDKAAARPFYLRKSVRKWFGENTQKENLRRTRLLETNPFLWLSARDPFQAKFVWIVIFIVTTGWLWGYLTWPTDWMNPSVYVMTALSFHLLLKFWFASEATNRFVQDRKTGALELMLSTPMTVDEILRGQRLALFRQFAGPVGYVLLLDGILMTLGLKHGWFSPGDKEQSLWVMVWLAGAGILLLDLWTLSWVGMWTGLSAKKVNRASGAALVRILILPWLVYFLFMTMLAFGSVFSSSTMDGSVFLIFWLIICVLNDVIFMTVSKNNLRSRFREMATQRFTSTKSWFHWLKGSSRSTPPPLPPSVRNV